jgi:FMN phosphatase YigB (HAD superfamily)
VKHRVSLLITDLDNTLFDWVGIWYKSFKALLDRLVRQSHVSREILLREFKAVHERYGTSEYSFSIQELPTLRTKYAGEDLTLRFKRAIEDFRTARRQALHLYPNVLTTLQKLRRRKCLLVGYTESLSYYTHYRIRSLGLDRVLNFVYSPPDHALPPGKSPTVIQLTDTLPRTFSRAARKTNPGVLLDIIESLGGTVDQTVYVGDSLRRDVVMAQQAKVRDVWARYGEAHQRKEFELLLRVSHWRKRAITRERNLNTDAVRPTHILERSFSEILEVFE